MLVLLLAYTITQSGFGGALPIASLEKRDDEPIQTRTTLNIVWSCLSTIFLCTWVSLHPNISSTQEETQENSNYTSKNLDDRYKKQLDWFKKLRKSLVGFLTYKLLLFLCALFVPEYILAWAIRQSIMARRVKKEVSGWTKTHGLFLVMGGFQLFDHDGKFVRILGMDDVRKHKGALAEIVSISRTTEEDIKDKGKSDGIAKAIVLFQTLWFVVECIARGIENHPPTELEIVTLAYVMMNIFIFFFWLHKPRDVGCPIRVYETVTTTRETRPNQSQPGLFIKISSYIIGSQDQYVLLSTKLRVPMFWSSSSFSKESYVIAVQATLGPSILGMAFEALHCIAWGHIFPSYVELMLWRTSCVVMVAAPFVTATGCTLALSGFRTSILFALDVLNTLSSGLYLVARATTMIVAFTTLRSLPSDAFIGTNWTTFIPHV